jgi:tRNA nucleotidyltransferase (CCA-adding enzyme)
MKNILQTVPESVFRVIQMAKDFAVSKNYKLYIVGGAVRDYYMSKKPSDIDIVVEGNGMELAELVAEKLGYKIVRHHKFLTATIKISEDNEIDFSTARKEIYRKPAALPDILPSTIEEDIKRRDFTINAIAISLNKNNELKVIDPYSGLSDIKNKIIRVLHNKSFIDDPTRAFRAVRYMTRFGFKIETRTRKLIYKALELQVFEQLSSSRIFNEMKLILSEKDPGRCIKNLDRFNLLKVFSDKIKVDRILLNLLSRIPGINLKLAYNEQWRICMVALFSRLSDNEIDLMIKRYPLDRQLIRALSQLPEFKKCLKSLNKKIKNSELFSILQDFSDEVIIFGIADTDSSIIRGNLLRFIEILKKIQPILSGNDLKKMKIPSGPLYSKILREVHLLYLDGRIKSRDGAFKWVKSRFL